MEFEAEVNDFLAEAFAHELRVILVGGAAVNHHGYKRHSADVDLWIEPSEENFSRLLRVLQRIGYSIDEIPAQVRAAEQNVSIKVSPQQEIELITRFDPGCTFEEAWGRCALVPISGYELPRYRVMAVDDLIESKLKAARPKDLLDVIELRRRNGMGDAGA
jgi:acetolactate synthase regulatory subunit